VAERTALGSLISVLPAEVRSRLSVTVARKKPARASNDQNLWIRRPGDGNERTFPRIVCLLVMIGIRTDGRKELIALADGFRESAESWADLLRLTTARHGRTRPRRG
jgi:hypothetical protein